MQRMIVSDRKKKKNFRRHEWKDQKWNYRRGNTKRIKEKSRKEFRNETNRDENILTKWKDLKKIYILEITKETCGVNLVNVYTKKTRQK